MRTQVVLFLGQLLGSHKYSFSSVTVRQSIQIRYLGLPQFKFETDTYVNFPSQNSTHQLSE